MATSLKLYELVVNGDIIGVFSSIKKAQQYGNKTYSKNSYSIFPLGTLLKTDIYHRIKR